MDRSTSLRRFFLAEAPADEPRLAPGEERHALRVLRLRAGEALLGLDGRGGVHPLLLRRVAGDRAELERTAPPRLEPRPGTPGSSGPWIEVAAPLPKGARAAEMLDRLTQLGLCAFRPLRCARSQGFAREEAEQRAEALERACREACKQARRAWLPELHPTAAPADLPGLLAGARCALLAPGAARCLVSWCEEAEAPRVAVIAGPEGGFDPAELEALAFAARAALGPHVLRIETACEAAVATVAQVAHARGGASR